MIVLIDVKLFALAQIRVLDIKNKNHYIYESKIPSRKIKTPNNILNSTNTFSNNKLSIEINNQLKNDEIKIKFSANQNKNMPAISGEICAIYVNCETMVVSIPFAENRGMYSHKGIAPMTGSLIINNEHIHFEKSSSYFITDDHKGYYPYKLNWDWVTAAYIGDQGIIGLNLTRNQSIDNEQYNENALWINGKLYKLPGVNFSFDGDKWYIKDKNGSIDLIFIAQYHKNVKIEIWPLLKSDYKGPFGIISGKIKVENNIISFDKVFAFGEQQYIKC
jgi:hypothetical protein